MSCQDRLAEGTSWIRTPLPLLSKPQATVLALWSLGMVLTRSCALSAVSVGLAALRQRKDNTVRQQVREWCYEAQAKRGAQRQALVVEDCFMPLLRWVLAHGQGTQLALALAATTLGLRCTGLAVSVVSRGCAIPVAWIILPANQPAAWRCHWLRLLRPASPKGHTVIVLADRGLYAPWLFRRIVRLGWHPFLRINRGGTFRPDPQAPSRPLIGFVPSPGAALARHWHGHQEPPPATAVYAAGLLGSRLHRAVVDPDRFATRGQRCRVVGAASVDRARLEDHPTRRLAVAA